MVGRFVWLGMVTIAMSKTAAISAEAVGSDDSQHDCLRSLPADDGNGANLPKKSSLMAAAAAARAAAVSPCAETEPQRELGDGRSAHRPFDFKQDLVKDPVAYACAVARRRGRGKGAYAGGVDASTVGGQDEKRLFRHGEVDGGRLRSSLQEVSLAARPASKGPVLASWPQGNVAQGCSWVC